ncbi:MAG: thiol:disulfide interchange protein DsbA/DsbL [Burkholderiales bacterium]
MAPPNNGGRRSFLAALAAGSAGLLARTAQAQQNLTPGKQYRLIPQQPLPPGPRIEVLYFFFYACPFCNELLPRTDAWLKRKPADVLFRRIPVVVKETWIPLAKLYYTLDALGVEEKLHATVFDAYHKQDLHMSQETVVTEWAVKQGIDRERFLAAYRSEDTIKKVARAREQTLAYEIEGTPSFVVDGRYLTSGGMVDRLPDLITVLDGLVRLARQQRIAK